MDPGYEIYEYSRRGALADLREALESGIGADLYQAYDGSTGLVMAARQGHAHIVRELLAYGADLQVRTDDGSTMLHHAVSGGSADAADMVVKAGLCVDVLNEDGVTPLMLAAHYGLGHMIDLLCGAGANMNLEADGWGTALDGAQGPAEAALERHGAKRSQRGKDQPLAAAAERFGYGCFDSGENPNAKPDKAPPPEKRATVGDSVRLRRLKPGLLKDGDVGVVVEDDGSDCVPLKVKLGDACDYYDYHDVATCPPAVELPPDSDRATAEGTKRYTTYRLSKDTPPSELSSTGLSISPVGFGCHRMEADNVGQRDALKLAIQLGCNFVDVAPNYTDGAAETVVGSVLKELKEENKLRRDEVIVATKVGNVLGKQMAHAEGVPGMTKIQDSLWHCISPVWIEQELTRSLERLQLTCVDCLLLHCPEFECKADEVDLEQVYGRLKDAFVHLESEVAKGRIAMYGISGAFYPLRPTDPHHLHLEEVMAQLPAEHHFRVLQFPMNFAEAQVRWVAHTPRNPDGVALDSELAQEAPTLFESIKNHGLASLINRPLDGIYKESHGVLRFSSLDCDVRSFSELQLDNCDSLEEKLTSMCKLSSQPYNAGEGACGQLAAKTVKVLSSVEGVDCVLLGMRKPEYVLGTLPLAFGTPRVPAETASAALKALNNTVAMWFATSINEADHGTSKDWRLPVDQKGENVIAAPVEEGIGA